jgi:integrase
MRPRLPTYGAALRSTWNALITETAGQNAALTLAVGHLAQHRAQQDAQGLVLGPAWRDHDLVFASSRGTPLEPGNANRRWDELRERADLDWLRLHDLRHGCATFMLAAGVPARTIMEVLGHSAISMTMNTYPHVLMQLREDAADAIDRVLGARKCCHWPQSWLRRRSFAAAEL